MSTMQKMMLRTGNSGPQRRSKTAETVWLTIAQDENSDGRSEARRRTVCRCSTEFDTVPMSSRPSSGMPTTNPATHVAKAGVRNRGWMRLKDEKGKQAIAGHGKPHARLSELEDENRRDHAHQRADQNEQAHPVQSGATGSERQPLECVDHWRRIAHHRLPGNDAAEHDSHSTVHNGAGDQVVAKMPMGMSRCGFLHSSAAVETESNPM